MALAHTGPRINPSNNKSPLQFRQLTRVLVPGHRPACSSPQGRGGLGPRHTKASCTIGTGESSRIVHLVPRKETLEEKGAKVIVEHEPNGLDMEFFFRLKHLGTPATRSSFAKPLLKGNKLFNVFNSGF